QAVAALEDAYRATAREHSLAEVEEMTERLATTVDAKGKSLRPLAREEERFILNELILTKADYRYWCPRYCKINVEGSGVERMSHFLGSQEFLLDRIAEMERQIAAGERSDGILVNLLKGARQTGGSTFAESVIAHRFSTQNNLFGLVASDVPGETGSGYI